MIRINVAIATPIHKGHNTHHHDQSITLQSLRTTKAISNRPPVEMPADLEASFAIYSMF